VTKTVCPTIPVMPRVLRQPPDPPAQEDQNDVVVLNYHICRLSLLFLLLRESMSGKLSEELLTSSLWHVDGMLDEPSS
jgi:hypothetical protein